MADMEDKLYYQDTICALSTPAGVGAIAVIRVSGPMSIELLSKVFNPAKGSKVSETPSHRMRFGTFYSNGEVLDEVLVSIFRGSGSFTGEESVEIACHGSLYIQNEILMTLVSQGARLAKPGEFSQRAFFNGKMDLAQTEAIADLITSETKSAHRVALQQMRGGFSDELRKMRTSLLDLVSLMELELDFSDEDVEFADRSQLYDLLNKSISHINALIESFKLGNVIKNGVPVVIVGATNTGKSTLLNAILGEERAIVSEIHGTTRDFIEDVVNISGQAFRFIDTAGIRRTKELIEIAGIERTYEKIQSASVVVLMLDAEREETFVTGIKELSDRVKEGQFIVVLLNKCDLFTKQKESEKINSVANLAQEGNLKIDRTIPFSAKNRYGLDDFKSILLESQQNRDFTSSATLVTNVRHYEALKLAGQALERVLHDMDDSLPTDLLTQDIREALFHIGEIIGEVSTDEILGNIFSKFCIGK